MAGAHSARVEWSLDGADFAGGSYSRRHRWGFDGSARVLASASPGIVPVPLSDPAGVDPEEAFVAAIAACHMLWFLDLARQAGRVVETYADDATGEMGRRADGRLWVARIELRPVATFAAEAPDGAALEALHAAAHGACFLAASVRTEIVVTPG